MTALVWSAALENGLARMDQTHREFVDFFQQLAAAEGEALLPAFDAFIEHTEAHFGQENRWMEAVGFPGCHRGEHDRVLAVLVDIRQRVANGDLFLLRRLIEELPAWFENHTNGMDAALAFHLDSIGYDVEREAFRAAEAAAGGAAAGKGCACAVLSAADEAAHGS